MDDSLECDWCEQDIEKGWKYVTVEFEDKETGVYHSHCRKRFRRGVDIETGVVN